MQGAIGLAGLCSGHAVFRCMSDGWPNTTSNGDSTHVRNTHDREPYLFTGKTERRAKLRQRDTACALRAAILSQRRSATTISFMSGIWVNSGTAHRYQPERLLQGLRPGVQRRTEPAESAFCA